MLWHVYAIYQKKSHLEEVEGARPELGSAAAWDVREGVLDRHFFMLKK